MTIAAGTTYKQTWVTRFGSFDALHYEELFDGEDKRFGIPNVLRMPLPHPLPKAFIDWPHRKSFPDGTGLHFFVDDYQFERVWNHPHHYVGEFKKRHPLVLSPQFSVFIGMPPVMAQWNTYRNRWLCRWYQEQGVSMLPTIAWGNESTFDFAFRGIPKCSVIAVTTIGRKTANEKANGAWDAGYIAAIEAIDPELVIVIGARMGEDLERLAETKYYDAHRTQRLKQIRAFEQATQPQKVRRSKSKDFAFDWTSKEQG